LRVFLLPRITKSADSIHYPDTSHIGTAPMDFLRYAAPLAIILAFYAVITGLGWLRRATGERAARRKGMILNLFRRAAPPTIAGLIVAVAGGILRLSGSTGIAGLLIAGGLAYAMHRGLADLGRQTWRDHGLRIALTAALSLFTLWQLAYL
jgi:hypothetical protein